MPRPTLLLFLLIAGCTASTPPLPQRAEPWPEPQLTLIWHGYGLGWRPTDDGWERAPTQDYEFAVVQRRYADHWESSKEVHRRHPDYDGAAGPRDATWHFTVSLAPEGSVVALGIDSSLGAGTGRADAEFREASMRIDAPSATTSRGDRDGAASGRMSASA